MEIWPLLPAAFGFSSLSKRGPVAWLKAELLLHFSFFALTLWPQLHKADSGDCPHIDRISRRSAAVPQTTYGTADRVPEAGILESWLPGHQQYAAELRCLAGELHLKASEPRVQWSPVWNRVKQALRTVSPEAFRCLESQIGTFVIPMKFLITLTTRMIL